MMSTGFLNIWNAIALPIQNGTAAIIAAIMAYVGPVFQASVVAYIIIMLLISAYSPSEDTALNMLKQIGLAAVLYTLISQQATFQYYVSGAATGVTNRLSTAIAGVFGGGGAPVTAASFDMLADKSYALGLVVMKQVPWYSMKGIPLGIAVIVYDISVSFAIAGLYIAFLIASIGMTFVIAFGPIFIALAFFPYTRRFFDGWVQAVVAAVLTQVFVVTLLTLFVVVMSNLLGQFGANIDGQADPGLFVAAVRNLCLAVAMAVIFCLLTVFALLLAKGISGGVGMAMPRVPIASIARSLGGSSARGGGGATSGAGQGGSSAGAGAGASGQPPRAYAFNHSVGSAP